MTTKICPECGGTAIVALRSMNLKLCSECLHEYDWNLDAGQAPLLATNRSTVRDAAPAAVSPEQREAIVMLGRVVESSMRYSEFTGKRDRPVAIHPRHAEALLSFIKSVDMQGA